MIQLNIKIDNRSDRQEFFGSKPAQIRRATAKTIRQITNDLHKELGGLIPRKADTSVVGYRAARAKKTTPKLSTRRLRGVVWMGTRRIPAIFGGKAVQRKGYVTVRGHKFDNSFIKRFKNGHIAIFTRIAGTNRIKEAKIYLPDAAAQVRDSVARNQARTRRIMRENLRKELTKKR